MDSWASEADDYHYDTNTCSGACGHYTQMVWDDTRRLGCGYKMCTTGSPFNGFPTWHFWVCDYDPRGNLNGIRPY
jgi:hypothetical protein